MNTSDTNHPLIQGCFKELRKQADETGEEFLREEIERAAGFVQDYDLEPVRLIAKVLLMPTCR